MPINLSSTRQFVRMMIKPRPSLRFSSSARGNLTRKRSFYRHRKGTQIYASSYLAARRTSAGTQNLFRGGTGIYEADSFIQGPECASPLEIEEEDRQYTGTETTTEDTSGISDINLDEFTWDSGERNRSTNRTSRTLRSYRHRKTKSIDEAELSLLRVKDGGDWSVRQTHTWPKTTSRSIESTLSSASNLAFKNLGPDPHDHGAQMVGICSADTSHCVTPQPTFLTSTPQARARTLQAVDPHTGVVFDRICQGGFPSNVHFPGHSSDLSYQLVSSTPTGTGSYSSAEEDDFAKPSMVLTVPTPIPPQSPVFVHQSPITVHKFFNALDEGVTSTEFSDGLLNVPSISQPPASLGLCGDCGLFEFEQGLQCQDCDRRWLACKVWYRAHDGGKKRWLSAPYIRPGESNAHNRAVMHGLGIPGCHDGPDGVVGLAGAAYDERPPTRVRKGLRRMRRFIKSRAVLASGSLRSKTSAATQLAMAERHTRMLVLRPTRRTLKRATEALGLRYLWDRLTGVWLVPSTHNTSGREN